jgi:hypothetical protein
VTRILLLKSMLSERLSCEHVACGKLIKYLTAGAGFFTDVLRSKIVVEIH